MAASKLVAALGLSLTSALQLATPAQLRPRATVSMYGHAHPAIEGALWLGDSNLAFAAGLVGTALLAPFMDYNAMKASVLTESLAETVFNKEDADTCAIVDSVPGPTASQWMGDEEDENERSWWICPGASATEDLSCRPVYYDGDYAVACAF